MRAPLLPMAVAAALIAMSSLLSPATAAKSADEGFRDGLSALNSGDYPRALAIWSDLARSGDPRSQAGLGWMYYHGLGVPVDGKEAVHWLTAAALHGQPDAQFLLGSLYFYGRGVPLDYEYAFAWCDLAQSGGQSDASACRDAALQGLRSAEEMRSAFHLAEELRAKISAVSWRDGRLAGAPSPPQLLMYLRIGCASACQQRYV